MSTKYQTRDQHQTQDEPTVQRPVNSRKLISVLRAAKAQQDLTAQPTKGRGLWLNSALWQAVTKQLETQVAEVEALQQQLLQQQQVTEELRAAADQDRGAQDRSIAVLQAQAQELGAEVAALQAQMRARQEAWDQHKRDLEAQADHLLQLLHERQGLLADNDGLRGALAAAQAAQAGAERRAAEALARATELERMHEYMMGKADNGLTERDAQAVRIRELTTALAEAKHQADTYRSQLATRSGPAEELTTELKRLRADNQRLVALLAKVPEYRALAAEVADERGVHYLPLEECLMARHLVEDLHPQLLDRPVDEIEGGLAGVGRRRDPDAPDPSLTVVLDEQYNWVPRAALLTGAAMMRRMMPGLPMAQLLALVGELNKIWRDRERARLAEVAAAHRQELKKLQQTFQQRAPYEAVVAGQKLTDLKRRLRSQAAQAAAEVATAKGEKRRVEDDSRVMLHAGLSSIQDLSEQVARLQTRNKKLHTKAAKQRSKAAKQGAPVCNTCLDRLLLPASAEAAHYLGRAVGLDSMQLGQGQGQAPAQAQTLTQQQTHGGQTSRQGTPGPGHGTGGPTGGVGGAYLSSGSPFAPSPYGASPYGGAYDELSPMPGRYQHETVSSRDERWERLMQAVDEPPVPAYRPPSTAFGAGGGGSMGHQQPTARGTGTAALADLYGSNAALVRVNVVQQSSSPAQSPAHMSVWRQREAAAAAAAGGGSGTPTRHIPMPAGAQDPYHPSSTAPGVGTAGAPPSTASAGGMTTLALEHTMQGLTITALPGTRVAVAGGGSGGGGGAGGGAALEFSTASLAEWRGAAGAEAGGEAPMTLQLQMGPGGGVSRSGAPSSAAGSAAGGGAGMQVGAAGTGAVAWTQPVRLSVRFPRQDVPTSSTGRS
ncbi:hypothetical protein HYH03_001370 [Edaphochlamys debaryana]|uniref:Uncharacterized protein n=1 Tax=Edaphochlamys debaryana TaxID=47281 RepID=A0A835YF71_9CHLO|nr:hypothetical protein HYH03_001370 [Edaphochlamys debaryana]|eukprot:KAG2500602.1 hypothetical protein HYH03_001370 [Edaphochlamys debaryana]